MKWIGRTFARGLLAVLPIAVTVAVLWWLGSMAEGALGELLRLALPEEYYRPGFGIVAGLVVVFLVGLLMHAWLVQQAIRLFENLLERLPLVKTIYGAIRDFAAFFRDDDDGKKLGRPVLLELGGAQLIGFVTRDDATALGLEGHVIVYLPMGYQIGGYTVAVPADAVRSVGDLNTQEAMRFALTAGIGTNDKPKARRP